MNTDHRNDPLYERDNPELRADARPSSVRCSTVEPTAVGRCAA